MINNLRIGNQVIAGIYLGNTLIRKMYNGNLVVYDTSGQTPCFEVVSTLVYASGDYVDVYCTGNKSGTNSTTSTHMRSTVYMRILATCLLLRTIQVSWSFSLLITTSTVGTAVLGLMKV